MSVEFEDFTIRVLAAIDEKAIGFLYEQAGELTAQIKRNVPSGKDYNSQLKDSFSYQIDESKLEATIGSPLERALWNEYGTGEFSDSAKGGRKGYWVYVKGNTPADEGGYDYYTGGKEYTLEEAKQIVAMMRADGLDARYTKGQYPKRSMRNAYIKMKPKIIREAQKRFKEL